MKKILFMFLMVFTCAVNTSFDAATTNVRVAYDSNGKVDYKNFYENGTRVKYENWDSGNKLQVSKFTDEKITSKVNYNKSGVVTKRTSYENGKRILVINYTNGKVSSKIEYDVKGNVTKRIKYANGVRNQITNYVNGYVTTRFKYNTSGKLINKQVWDYGTLRDTVEYKNGKVTSRRIYNSNGNLTKKVDGNNTLVVKYNPYYSRDYVRSKVYYTDGVRTKTELWNINYRKYLIRYDGNSAVKNEYTAKGRLYSKTYYENKVATRKVLYRAEKGSYTINDYKGNKYTSRTYRDNVLYESATCKKVQHSLLTPCDTTYYNKAGYITKREYAKDSFFVVEYYTDGELSRITTNLGGHAYHQVKYEGNTTIVELLPYCGGEPVWIQKSYLGVPYSSKLYDHKGNFKEYGPTYSGNLISDEFIDFEVDNNLSKYDTSFDEQVEKNS